MTKLALLLSLIAGCGSGGLAKVQGTVTRQDGTPLAGARVIARSQESGIAATGGTDEKGHFELRQAETGAGIPAGDYDVLVAEDRGPMDAQASATISLKYQRASTSGLQLSVAAGEKKVVEWTLDPPDTSRRRGGR
jgi:hypothetical protein